MAKKKKMQLTEADRIIAKNYREQLLAEKKAEKEEKLHPKHKYFLQILIPQYKEGEDVIKPLLDTIATQKRFDMSKLGVIIVNDGTDVILSDEFLAQYNFHIDYYKEEHRGIGGTRNRMLDLADADFVMFCDDDDYFLSNLAFFVLDECVYDNGKDKVSGVRTLYCAETHDENKHLRLMPQANDTYHIHGTYFNLDALNKYNIRFDGDLKYNDDVYFTSLFNVMYWESTYSVNTPIYVWAYNEKSATRIVNNGEIGGSNGEYLCLVDYCKCILSVLHWYEEHNIAEDEIVNHIINVLTFVYYLTSQKSFAEYDKDGSVMNDVKTILGTIKVVFKEYYDLIFTEKYVRHINKHIGDMEQRYGISHFIMSPTIFDFVKEL